MTTGDTESQNFNIYTIEFDTLVTFTTISIPSDWWKKISSYTWKIEYSNGRKEEIKYQSVKNGVNITMITIEKEKRYKYLIFEYSVDKNYLSYLKNDSSISYEVEYEFY